MHEARGSLSLAVHRAAIASVQTLPIPVDPAAALGLLSTLEAKMEDCVRRFHKAGESVEEPSPLERLILHHRPSRFTTAQYHVRADAMEWIAQALLPDVSPAVRDVIQAMQHWQNEQQDPFPPDLVNRWVSMAALLTQPVATISRVSSQPPRPIT